MDIFTCCERRRFINEHWTVQLTLVYNDFILTTSIFNSYDVCIMTRPFFFLVKDYLKEYLTLHLFFLHVVLENLFINYQSQLLFGTSF